jgi:CubicO group peptidase (beta-lactamase class C family)
MKPLQIQLQNRFKESMSLNGNAFCLSFIFFSFFLLNFQAAHSQYNFTGLDQLLAARQKQLGNKLVAVVYKDGKTIYKKELGEDFKADTPEPIGAASKWLTAALVLTFVDDGTIKLDDPVSKYLPIFAQYSKKFITIRHCLSEVTGIEPTMKKLDRLTSGKGASLEEEVNNYAAKKDILNHPGKDFNYGNIGYNIAGRVLESVSKRKTFSRLMMERICKPLGMKRTTFVEEAGAESPATGGVSSANDYLKFLAMLLDGGEAMGKRVLSPESVELLLNLQTEGMANKFTPTPVQGYGYTFGAWVQETGNNGKATVISSPGLFGTWPYIDRCRKYAAVIFTRQLKEEQKKEIYLPIVEEINSQMKGCD